MQLSPELLAQIQAAIADGTLQLGNPAGRSPLRPRQLNDLRILPRADDPRPTFFWSSEAPRHAVDLTKTTEFPKLLWHGDTGQEITVMSSEEQGRRLSMGYVFTAPSAVVLDPMEQLQEQWAALSPADQALILESQKQDRIASLKQKLSVLPEAKLAEMMSDMESAKRGPGRPRKDAA